MTYEHLKPYATETQLFKLEQIEEHGSVEAAARANNQYDGANWRKMVRKLEKKAAIQGVSPQHDMTHPAPETHYVKGTSTLYKEGEPVLQWVKTNAKADALVEIMRETCDALKEDLPKYKKTKAPKYTNEMLANQYTITDYHFGMLAWGEETGADWDLDIAEQLLFDWFSAAVMSAPDAELGIFAQLGDALHFDGMLPTTPTHGHVLDADTRFQKLVKVAIRAIRRVIDMLLKKHKHVHVIMATGNHDLASSVWLREMIAHVYDKEPRLTVDLSPDIYYGYQWGSNSLFYHHGHKRKPGNISQVFAAKFREMLGSTKRSYAHMGHLHHIDIKEDPLMVIEQHRTLAAPDSHASAGGWISGRSASVITYHKDYGQTGRIELTPEMVKGAVA